MTNTQLMLLYLVGWIPMIYIGMTINNRMWRRAYKNAIRRAYNRGWDAGFGFLNKISDAKIEQESSVRILK